MDDILALNNLFMNAMNKPVIPISSNTTITLNQSGKVFELNSPSANTTITLPTPTNGFNAIFVGNNSSSYTYTFTTPSGGIIWNNTSSANVTPNTANGVYFLVSDGTNYLMGYELGASITIPSNSISVTGGDLTMSGTTGTAITNATLVATGVTAETYGSSTQIPQLTIDVKGRVTGATVLPLFTAQNTVVFTSSDSWTVPEGVTTILVSGCGGGSGGAKNSAGQAGFHVLLQVINVTPGHTLSITIGGGGAGTLNYGNAGGTTSIVDSTSSTTLLSLAGGAALMLGGETTFSVPGQSSPWGRGGPAYGSGGANSYNGGNADGYGAGGGQCTTNASGTTAGGSGTSGIIIIQW